MLALPAAAPADSPDCVAEFAAWVADTPAADALPFALDSLVAAFVSAVSAPLLAVSAANLAVVATAAA